MDLFSIIFLIALGGSFGGITSAVAQNNLNNSYSIRVPFLVEKDSREARIIPLGFLGNIIIGAAASISIFFIADSLFNLQQNQPSQNQDKTSTINNRIPTIFNPSKVLNFSNQEATNYAKIFSISVAAGFAGISIMEGISKRVESAVTTDQSRKEIQVETISTNEGEVSTIRLSEEQLTKTKTSLSDDLADIDGEHPLLTETPNETANKPLR
nr:hypothetical protein [Nostoc sp. ChiQUE02]MDZ8228797.1 hypothetical protein [Nostoc sp. ChiQUE02]